VNNTKVPRTQTVDRTELATKFRFALFPLVRQLRHHNVDLTASQASALATISRRGPLTVGELAKAEHVSSPMITKIAKGLEEDGLVTRTVDETDKRVTQMAITKEGERRLERSRSRKNAWLAQQFDHLSPEELDAIRAVIPVLERIAARGAGE
jgi:DNA-binding MarR family transcriptional regulator